LVFRKLFGRGGKPANELDADDLIVLERYGEAEQRLKSRLQTNPNDLHAHVKLAEVYSATGQLINAVEEFVFAADEYADDGFYDKGIALLAKAAKLAPLDETLPQRLEKLEARKRLEHTRQAAVEGIQQQPPEPGTRPHSLIEAQQLAMAIEESPLLRRLSTDALKRLMAAMATLRAGVGAVVAEKGARREELLLVVQGGLTAIFEHAAGTADLRSFGPGDVVGESALLERRPWPATYRVTQRSILFKLDREGLERALTGNPDPRSLIDALREQRHDEAIAAAMRKLEAG
jgi:tetratricopeptide (TPR) repeat protein